MSSIVRIDSEKCNGCGACVNACAEGAIKMVDGKAVLVSEAYCDGLGACLGTCPTGAITIVERPSSPQGPPSGAIPMAACPGSGMRVIKHEETAPGTPAPGRLSQWPVQLRLVPSAAPFFDGRDLLVASDCSAFACGDFHERFIRGRAVVIGCPKLDPSDCWTKLKDIVALHDIGSITVTRMEVPCCSGLVNAVLSAVESSGKDIPVRVFTVHPDGNVTE